MKKLIILTWTAVVLSTGCATLNKGADPLVVRAEQLETIASATFQTVVELDAVNRPFWRTNAPAFHQFAEWLRTPVPSGTNTQRRGIAMVLALNESKRDYKSNHSQSNLLNSIMLDLQSAVTQAQAWQTIVTH